MSSMNEVALRTIMNPIVNLGDAGFGGMAKLLEVPYSHERGWPSSSF